MLNNFGWNLLSTSCNFKYPIKKGSTEFGQMPLSIKVTNAFRKTRSLSLPVRDSSIKIWVENKDTVNSLNSDDLPLIFLVRNDKKMIPSFLSHYRKLGVTRFICLDDQSTDGTFELLSQQDDVDLYRSNVRYKDANRGKAWREKLVDIYGKNRWYLNVDSDEYLFAGNDEVTSLLEYTKKLEAVGIKRLPAPMLDLIPAVPVSQADFNGNDETMPWEVASHFDAEGYIGEVNSIGLSIKGGARVRLFAAVGELMKYPLLYWDDATSLGKTVHFPKPSEDNFAPACGCLLHFKIFSDVNEIARKGAEDGQYFLNGQEYARMQAFFEEHDGSALTYEHSAKFENQDQLIDLGFIIPV